MAGVKLKSWREGESARSAPRYKPYSNNKLRVFLGPSSKMRETRKWPHAWLKAGDGNGTSARVHSLTKSEVKERLLAVYSNKVSIHKWHKNFKKQTDFLFLQERRTPTNNKSCNSMKKTWNGLRRPKKILTPGAVGCGRKLWQTITYGLAAFIPFCNSTWTKRNGQLPYPRPGS